MRPLTTLKTPLAIASAFAVVFGALADPLDHWQLRNPYLQGSYLYSMAHGNGRFVAVGSFGAIVTSPDGLTWTNQNSGTARQLSAVTYANGQFVCVGILGTILTSTDAVTWVSRNTGTTTPLRSVSYGNGYFVAVGSGSDDDDVILRSPDGVNWASVGPPPFPSYRPSAVAFGNGLFVAVGYRFLTSTDGATWTNRTSTNGFPSLYPSGVVAFGNGLFVAASTVYGFLTSTDGASWTTVPLATTLTTLNDVTYANGTFVAVGGDILTSTDGAAWTTRSAGITISSFLYDVAYGNGTFVAVGDAYTTGYLAVLLTSNDGLNWINRSFGWERARGLTKVSYGNGTFVALGESGILASTDGNTWSRRGSPAIMEPFGFAYGNGTFVTISGWPQYQGIATSSDGITWINRGLPWSTLFILYGIAYGQGTFVAVGGERGTILQSGSFAPADLRFRSRPNDMGVELTVTGEIGRSYRLQASTALPQTNWTDIASFTLTQITTNILESSATNFPQRFYRAVSP